MTALYIAPALSPAFGQQRKPLPRIGFIDPYGAPASDVVREAFERGLRELGWIDRQNVLIEYRSTLGDPDRYPAVAAELVKLNVNVIVTGGEALIQATTKATSTIPIVMATSGDPVGAGFAASLARPGRNVTGMSNLAVGLPGKWLELLKESLPRASRFAVLRNLANPSHDKFWSELEAGAAKLGVSVFSVGYRAPADLEIVLVGATRQKPAAVLVLPDPLVVSHHTVIAEFVKQARLPSVHLSREEAVAGGLFSYGPSRPDNFRRAASYVDKILRGANPAELPIEQPTKFELVVNLKTARALGITIPQSMLVRADRVIE
jgi:putative ABC transport system substrate-binding protein